MSEHVEEPDTQKPKSRRPHIWLWSNGPEPSSRAGPAAHQPRDRGKDVILSGLSILIHEVVWPYLSHQGTVRIYDISRGLHKVSSSMHTWRYRNPHLFYRMIFIKPNAVIPLSGDHWSNFRRHPDTSQELGYKFARSPGGCTRWREPRHLPPNEATGPSGQCVFF